MVKDKSKILEDKILEFSENLLYKQNSPCYNGTMLGKLNKIY